MKDFLSIIGENSEIFRIIGKDKSAYLESDNGKLISGDNYERPIYCSELRNKLSRKLWFNGVLKIAEKDDYALLDPTVLNNKLTPTTYNNVINITNTVRDISVKCSGKISDPGTVTNKFNELFPSIDGIEIINLIESEKRVGNVDNRKIVFDAIAKDSDTYTNTLNITDIIKEVNCNGKNLTADISIKYVKAGQIYSITEFYCLVSVENGKKIVDDFVNIINNDIQLEFINGTIQVYPINIDVTEFIIENCTIEYGD